MRTGPTRQIVVPDRVPVPAQWCQQLLPGLGPQRQGWTAVERKALEPSTGMREQRLVVLGSELCWAAVGERLELLKGHWSLTRACKTDRRLQVLLKSRSHQDEWRQRGAWHGTPGWAAATVLRLLQLRGCEAVWAWSSLYGFGGSGRPVELSGSKGRAESADKLTQGTWGCSSALCGCCLMHGSWHAAP